MDLNGVDWQALGTGLGTALAAAGAALVGMRRMWRKGLGDLLRPVVQAEVSRAGKALSRDVRAAMREETQELRTDLDDVKERLTHLEGAVDTLTNLGTRQQ